MADFVEFGWSAPPMAEQFPTLSAKEAQKFDALNKAIIMCHLHGLIPDSVRDSAIRKCSRQIGSALAASRPMPAGTAGNAATTAPAPRAAGTGEA